MVELDDRLKGGELGWFARAVYALLQTLVRVFSLVYWRASATNTHHMPRTGGVIVAPVHRSNLDVPLVGASNPRRLRYFAKDTLFVKPFWRWFLTMLGAFPVRRDASDRQAIAAAQRVLERGESLVMFPEGERKSGPVVLPLLHGVGYMAARTQTPIVPVGIGGTERSMPKGAHVPRPTKVVFLYGEPLPPPAMRGKRVDRSDITRVTDELYDRLQDLFDEAQRLAGCPNPPRDED